MLHNHRMEPKFDADLIKLILDDIKEYVPISIAALSNGISYQCFKKWRIRGEKDLEANIKSEYSEMVTKLNKIYSAQVKENIGAIRLQQKGHLGSQYALDRRFSSHFSSRAEILELHERLDAMDVENKKDLADEINSIKAPKNPN